MRKIKKIRFDKQNQKRANEILQSLKEVSKQTPVLIVKRSGLFKKNNQVVVIIDNRLVKWDEEKKQIVFTPLISAKLTESPEITLKSRSPLDMKMKISFEKGKNYQVIIGIKEIIEYLEKHKLEDHVAVIKHIMPAFGGLLEEFPDFNLEGFSAFI